MSAPEGQDTRLVAQVAALSERVHALSGKQMETNQNIREMSASIRDVTREFNAGIGAQAKEFLAALKEMSDRHERELDAVNARFSDYVKKGEVSTSWQVVKALVTVIGWLAALGGPAVYFTLAQRGVIRP